MTEPNIKIYRTNLRKCKGKYYVRENFKYVTKYFSLGYFHQWGCDYEEFESGAGNYSVAIVELQDGKIIMPHARDITFIDKYDGGTEND